MQAEDAYALIAARCNVDMLSIRAHRQACRSLQTMHTAYPVSPNL